MTLLKTKLDLFGTGPGIPVHDILATVDFYCDVVGFDSDFVTETPTSLYYTSFLRAYSKDWRLSQSNLRRYAPATG